MNYNFVTTQEENTQEFKTKRNHRWKNRKLSLKKRQKQHNINAEPFNPITSNPAVVDTFYDYVNTTPTPQQPQKETILLDPSIFETVINFQDEVRNHIVKVHSVSIEPKHSHFISAFDNITSKYEFCNKPIIDSYYNYDKSRSNTYISDINNYHFNKLFNSL
jgi:hypothetical protein